MGSAPDTSMITYGAGTIWFKSSEGDMDVRIINAVRSALDAGYRSIDAAQMYNTELEIGLAIEQSGIPRSEIFLGTKAASLDNIEASLEASLSKLRTSYVDSYLIHSPFSDNHLPSTLQKAWLEMERCFKRGLTRRIGVSNFAIQHLECILEVATIKPSLNQIEMHPYLQQPDLLAYLKRTDIGVQAFASLTPLTKAAPGPADEVCSRLAEKYGVSQSTILLRWVMDQNIPVVTTSGNKERMKKTLMELSSFQLQQAELEEITRVCKSKTFRGFFAQDFQKLEQVA